MNLRPEPEFLSRSIIDAIHDDQINTYGGLQVEAFRCHSSQQSRVRLQLPPFLNRLRYHHSPMPQIITEEAQRHADEEKLFLSKIDLHRRQAIRRRYIAVTHLPRFWEGFLSELWKGLQYFDSCLEGTELAYSSTMSKEPYKSRMD